MKKCLKSTLVGAVVGGFVLGYAAPASALSVGPSVYATTIGQYSAISDSKSNVTLTPDFYSISYQGAAGASITSVTYDLTKDLYYQGTSGSGFFNFDSTNFGTAPLLDTSSLTKPAGVTYTPQSGQANTLTFNFQNGAFQAGNSFGFGLDAEWVDGPGVNGNGQSSGLDFGNAAIPLTITFSNGYSVTANFAAAPTTSQPYRSALTVAAPATVPLPGAVWLFGSGLVGLAGLARRRKAA